MLVILKELKSDTTNTYTVVYKDIQDKDAAIKILATGISDGTMDSQCNYFIGEFVMKVPATEKKSEEAPKVSLPPAEEPPKEKNEIIQTPANLANEAKNW